MSPQPKIDMHHSAGVRLGYTALGLFFVGLGIVGAFLPVMPTTCFMLAALWAFSKGSPRLHRWLWEHERLGGSLRRWRDHQCIPVSAKFAAILSMSGSMTYLLLWGDLSWPALAAATSFVGIGAFLVLRAPSRPPGSPQDCAKPEAAAAQIAKSSAAAQPAVVPSKI